MLRSPRAQHAPAVMGVFAAVMVPPFVPCCPASNGTVSPVRPDSTGTLGDRAMARMLRATRVRRAQKSSARCLGPSGTAGSGARTRAKWGAPRRQEAGREGVEEARDMRQAVYLPVGWRVSLGRRARPHAPRAAPRRAASGP